MYLSQVVSQTKLLLVHTNTHTNTYIHSHTQINIDDLNIVDHCRYLFFEKAFIGLGFIAYQPL